MKGQSQGKQHRNEFVEKELWSFWPCNHHHNVVGALLCSEGDQSPPNLTITGCPYCDGVSFLSHSFCVVEHLNTLSSRCSLSFCSGSCYQFLNMLILLFICPKSFICCLWILFSKVLFVFASPNTPLDDILSVQAILIIQFKNKISVTSFLHWCTKHHIYTT